MIGKPQHIPASTYRLQLRPGFGFRQAQEIVPYLNSLGITDCYISPILAPRPGSSHGYDVCDHNRLNPELGSREDFDRFCETLQKHSMGLVLDFVPNHMGVDPQANLPWRSVLENGPSSPFACFFDIDWNPVKDELKDKVLLPVLDNQYGNVLEAGKLQILIEGGGFSLQYYDHNFPLNPRQSRLILTHNIEALRELLGEESPDLRELLSIIFHLEHIPAFVETAPEMVAARDREKAIAAERLSALTATSTPIREHIESNVRAYNGTPGDSQSFDLLHQLLDLQAYRLSYWTTAVHEINYRRFFDINELAGIRMEDPMVFEATHALLRELTRQKLVTGLRLDHVDGLFNPKQYFADLQQHCAPDEAPLYVLVEKILSLGENLRSDWDIHGTTGYEFLNDIVGLFVDPVRSPALHRLYVRFSGRSGRFADLVYESKKLIVATSMASELNVLAHELNRISESDRRYRDFTLDSLQEGLREVVACFPVYRSYVTAEGHDSFDERAVDAAVSDALRRNPALEPSMFAFIRAMLLPQRTPGLSESEYERHVRFAMKFQQYTGPVQAKGVEDTVFYRYAPLSSLNEVGGDPVRFGRTVEEFHKVNRQRKEQWPLSMLSSSTHDTKRGEDTRSRISALSEIPDDFRAALFRWARSNAGLKKSVDGNPSPDRADEYLYYQTLLGAWPNGIAELPPAGFVERMRNYMLKAIKEEKVHSSWIHPHPEYDDAVCEFVRRTLTGVEGKRFLRTFLPFQQRVAQVGLVNSLAQLVLKAVSPGVPDIYQGTEFWDLTLVDPDNRRPVDFSARTAILNRLQPLLQCTASAEHFESELQTMTANWSNGEIKLFCTAAVLNLRRRLRDLFLFGDYIPLETRGECSEHVVALGRQHGSTAVLALVPRLCARFVTPEKPFPIGREIWCDTEVFLAEQFQRRRYRNLFTGAWVQPDEALILGHEWSKFPYCLLVTEN
ncbi:MAG TPA: malto-oligosyltrehalose synthase [Terracidiphilus sp.]|nr:malto-oligosyltrehalose synthase [Terracidiphilus sp.]